MNSDTVRAGNPSPEAFAGSSPRLVAKRLFFATRPAFFPASILPILAGSAWGFGASGNFDIGILLLTLLGVICVHAAANVLNDVSDDTGGTDRRNKDRIYPYTGGSRFIQNGILTAAEMGRLGISGLVLAAAAGLFLLLVKDR